jgi:hypothetical protein
MGLVERLLGRPGKNDAVDERGVSRLQSVTRERTRRELISMAVRDTLKKHGLADSAITAEALPSVTATKHRCMHIQLVFRDWQPSLLAYVVALESAVKERLHRLDPLSPSWITGMSWRFEPHDRKVWPQLPTPAPASTRVAPARPADAGRPQSLEKLLRSGDEVFMGTVHAQLAAPADFSPTLPMRA